MDFSLLTKFNLLSKYPTVPVRWWYRKAETAGEKAVFFTSVLTGQLVEERALPGFSFVSRKGSGGAWPGSTGQIKKGGLVGRNETPGLAAGPDETTKT